MDSQRLSSLAFATVLTRLGGPILYTGVLRLSSTADARPARPSPVPAADARV